MRFHQLRLRTMMIAVAIAASMCLFAIWGQQFDATTALASRASSLDRRSTGSYSTPTMRGNRALGEGRFRDAEQEYRAALLAPLPEPREVYYAQSRLMNHRGVAEAMAGQGRLDEAVSHLQMAVAEGLENLGTDDPVIANLQQLRKELVQVRQGTAGEPIRAASPTP